MLRYPNKNFSKLLPKWVPEAKANESFSFAAKKSAGVVQDKKTC